MSYHTIDPDTLEIFVYLAILGPYSSMKVITWSIGTLDPSEQACVFLS